MCTPQSAQGFQKKENLWLHIDSSEPTLTSAAGGEGGLQPNIGATLAASALLHKNEGHFHTF